MESLLSYRFYSYIKSFTFLVLLHLHILTHQIFLLPQEVDCLRKTCQALQVLETKSSPIGSMYGTYVYLHDW